MNVFPATTDDQLRAILRLQAQNVPQSLSAEALREQGFVTVRHDLALLRRMNEREPHAIARTEAGALMGYALVMTPHFRAHIDVLRSMFDRIDRHTYAGTVLRDAPYCIMGQICVARPHRGRGVVDALYAHLDERLARRGYRYLITLIADRNPRSLRVHARVGFQPLERYVGETGEDWHLVIKPLPGYVSNST